MGALSAPGRGGRAKALPLFYLAWLGLLIGLAAAKGPKFSDYSDGAWPELCQELREDIESASDDRCILAAARRKTGAFKASLAVGCLIMVVLASTTSWFLVSNKIHNGRHVNLACLSMSTLGTLASMAVAWFSPDLGWKPFLNSVCECHQQGRNCWSEAQTACWKENADIFFSFEQDHASLVWLPIGFGLANLAFLVALLLKSLGLSSSRSLAFGPSSWLV